MGEIRDFNPGKHGEPPNGIAPRRLAAIIAGDIAGYSRLMQQDEEGTHARVRRIQRDLIEPSILEHHGRLVKTTGDGFIATFDSPVEAVRCSIVIQQNMVGRNASMPHHSRIEYRIGVNLGDVIIETDDVYGDGVNIACRIEGIAEPGEVFISGGIYEQIKHKLVCGYESLGDRRVKNITDPVRVYRVLPDPAALNRRRRRENILIMLLGIIMLAIGAGALWHWLPLPYEQSGDQRLTPVSPQMPSLSPSPPPAPDQSKQALSTQLAPAPAATQATPQGTPPSQPATPVREPQMNLLPGGAFMMGSNDDASEKPIHQVTVKPLAISRYPISIREWNQCAAAHACAFAANGDDDAPVTNISW